MRESKVGQKHTSCSGKIHVPTWMIASESKGFNAGEVVSHHHHHLLLLLRSKAFNQSVHRNRDRRENPFFFLDFGRKWVWVGFVKKRGKRNEGEK